MNQISNFNGNVEKWSYDSELSPSQREINFFDISSYDFSCELNISSRIGSVSTMGEVYKISVNIQELEKFIAVKILPILSDKSFKSNENEIRLALEVSELVIKGESIYFPIVYNFAECEETHFYGNRTNSLNFYERSLRYQQFQTLYNSNISIELKNKVMEFKKALKSSEFVFEYLKNNSKDLNITSLPTKVASHLLFSELASYDLNFYLENYRLSFKDMIDILYKIFLAIQDLHTKLNILHNDLHLGNILIMEEIIDDSVIETPLIHDFGNSEKINFNKLSHRDRIKDINYFMSHFWDKVKILYPEDEIKDLRILFNEIDDILLDSENIYPINDVVEYLKNF
jgi:hypothetical protein